MEFDFPEELKDMFAQVSAIYQARQRQADTMLAGFIATGEKDLDYMDSHMDPLYDFVEQGIDTEETLRKYISYLSTFRPQEAKERLEDLENQLGYKTVIIFAAGLLAQKLHAGQKDKGGNDYFSSHLLKVGMSGHDWKEKVVGFLHDTIEDTPVTVPELLKMLADKTDELASTPMEEWWQEWMDDVMPCAGEVTHPMTDYETSEICETLNLLNHNTVATREEYINRFRGHRLAIKVKLNDIANNMDLSRIPHPSENDSARVERYQKEQQQLLSMLNELYD